MYTCYKGSPRVEIKLENGIYVFEHESATGKSYLARRLKELRCYSSEPVDSFTFQDTRVHGDICSTLDGPDFTARELQVLLLDRYDLYCGKYTDFVNSLKDCCIVLVDCKGLSGLQVTDMCWVKYSKQRIVVGV